MMKKLQLSVPRDEPLHINNGTRTTGCKALSEVLLVKLYIYSVVQTISNIATSAICNPVFP
jgi:hypothetical protein